MTIVKSYYNIKNDYNLFFHLILFSEYYSIIVITNDNKTLTKKLKIIQDKFNKLQIQNQDYINYNSDNEQNNINYGIDLFEEYRNLYLEFLLYKINEKNYISILRKYLYKYKNITFALNTKDKSNEALIFYKTFI